MRKDYVAYADSVEHETHFVEKYWTRVWEQEGGPQGRIEHIPRKDEFRIMFPYLKLLPRSAKIFDGGCGLGEWVLALSGKGFEVVGMDISRQTITRLGQLFPNAVIGTKLCPNEPVPPVTRIDEFCNMSMPCFSSESQYSSAT